MCAVVDHENLRLDVDAALSRKVAELSAQIAAISPDGEALGEQIASLLGGGKRLRAAFAYWGFRACGGSAAGPKRQAAVRVGAALELFQASALFHDDVLDAAETRRGHLAAHRVFAARHVAAGWAGDADRFGEGAAILLGDLCLIAAQRELSAALIGIDSDRAEQVRATFDRMGTEVMIGQFLDVQLSAQPWGDDPLADEERTRVTVCARSASYSVRYPLLLGAHLAGADEATLAALDAFGLPLGEAFQLRDDVLGVFGDSSITGKPSGDDLREGKRTVLAARTMRLGNAAQRSLLSAKLGDPDLTEDDICALRAAITDSGALAATEALIADLTAQALAALTAAPLTDPGRSTLYKLADITVRRTF
ncbi:MAG: polyprenyl synthetase family protein [Promicromonosporaceae bacterium]|nr:polyprenyl synthetase family protein [Promicromonosporaceae bacterium]